MKILEIKRLIDEKTKTSILLNKQITDLRNEINYLRSQFNQLEMEEFVNYLQIGEIGRAHV